MEQIVVGQTLVNDVAQALGAGFRREGESSLAGSTKDVGDVVVKPVHPLTGRLQGHVLIRQTVAQLPPPPAEPMIAAERQQREVV